MKKHNGDSDVYVKLDSSSAYDAKRTLLEMTESIIRMQMISEKLKKMHKGEISKRNDFKKHRKMMILELNHTLEKMPKVKIEKPKEEKIVAEVVKKPSKKEVIVPKKIERKTLNDELQDIKKKIESLKK